MKKGKDPLSAAFAKVLREARQTAGLSQERMSHLAGIDRSHTGRIERGERVPSLAAVFALSKSLEIAPSELVRRVEKQLKTG